MPPLRDRVEDIPLLVNELVRRIEHEKRGSVRLSPGAIYALCQYSWPGNVRELANLVERLAILHPYGVVDAGDLPEKFQNGEIDVTDKLVDALVGAPVTSEDLDPRLPRDGLESERASRLHGNQLHQTGSNGFRWSGRACRQAAGNATYYAGREAQEIRFAKTRLKISGSIQRIFVE